jgi:hypothetical protein
MRHRRDFIPPFHCSSFASTFEFILDELFFQACSFSPRLDGNEAAAAVQPVLVLHEFPSNHHNILSMCTIQSEYKRVKLSINISLRSFSAQVFGSLARLAVQLLLPGMKK